MLTKSQDFSVNRYNHTHAKKFTPVETGYIFEIFNLTMFNTTERIDANFKIK